MRTTWDKYPPHWSPFEWLDGSCVQFNDLQSCTSGQCMWKKKSKKNEGSLPIKDLQRSSGDYEVMVRLHKAKGL